jgi:hypothetical protein
MCTFILKSYNQKDEISKPHFFILNKGNNSGKPLLNPCPNCFSIQFQSESDKEQVYWLFFCLWQSKAFYQYLRGSVIPFIILRDVKSCIQENLDKAAIKPEQFKKMVAAFQSVNKIENQLKQNLKAIDKAKQLILYSFLV